MSSTPPLHSLFDDQSNRYAQYRPTYTPELYNRVLGFAQLDQRNVCLDVATGQGQAAAHLATLFKRVVAIDANENQLKHAQKADNIEYRVADAHDTGLQAGTVDLVTVAQALHWFDLESFYKEAARILQPRGCLAAWTYDMCTFPAAPAATDLLYSVYEQRLGPYWSNRRKLVEARYQGIAPGPHLFSEVEHIPDFPVRSMTTIRAVVGYVTSWSSYATYCKAHPEEGAAIPAELEAGLLQCFSTNDPDHPVEIETGFALILARLPVKSGQQ